MCEKCYADLDKWKQLFYSTVDIVQGISDIIYIFYISKRIWDTSNIVQEKGVQVDF